MDQVKKLERAMRKAHKKYMREHAFCATAAEQAVLFNAYLSARASWVAVSVAIAA